MNWLWAYFRKNTMESILAGVHDALSSSDGQAGLNDEQAARAVRVLTGGPTLMPNPTAALTGTDPTPQLPAPPASGDGISPDQRRGPGRPRKFQEPPQ